MVRPELLHYELTAAGLPVSSVDINGVVIYERTLIDAEKATASQIIAAHDPSGLLPWEIDKRDYIEARQAALQLLNDGITSWAAMTGTQKQAWISDHMDEIMKILRALIKITT